MHRLPRAQVSNAVHSCAVQASGNASANAKAISTAEIGEALASHAISTGQPVLKQGRARGGRRALRSSKGTARAHAL